VRLPSGVTAPPTTFGSPHQEDYPGVQFSSAMISSRLQTWFAIPASLNRWRGASGRTFTSASFAGRPRWP